jgi:hypothetical protein
VNGESVNPLLSYLAGWNRVNGNSLGEERFHLLRLHAGDNHAASALLPVHRGRYLPITQGHSLGIGHTTMQLPPCFQSTGVTTYQSHRVTLWPYHHAASALLPVYRGRYLPITQDHYLRIGTTMQLPPKQFQRRLRLTTQSLSGKLPIKRSNSLAKHLTISSSPPPPPPPYRQVQNILFQVTSYQSPIMYSYMLRKRISTKLKSIKETQRLLKKKKLKMERLRGMKVCFSKTCCKKQI